ncbi:MAG: hypothetical protein R3208_15125 [Ketobacteraceae bacterium]|nr:hypothetical protein [Ketobacteraceae bacterium]
MSNKLPISRNTLCWLNYLVSWYDTSLDWDNPPDMGQNWEENEDRFYDAAREGYHMLEKELKPQGYVIENGMDL